MIPERISEKDYLNLVLRKCKENHISLNEMRYLEPTDEQKIKLANIILQKLRCSSTQIPYEGITSDSESFRELAALTPVLYLTVSWS